MRENHRNGEVTGEKENETKKLSPKRTVFPLSFIATQSPVFTFDYSELYLRCVSHITRYAALQSSLSYKNI